MAKQGKLQTFLEYAAAKSVLVTLGHLPAPAAITLGQSVGKLAYLLAGSLRKTGATNLRLAFPEKTDEERAELLRECFNGLGRQLGLFSQFATRRPEDLQELIEVHGLEHLETAKAHMNSGVILITAHLGAWELTSFGPSLLGHPFSFLVRRIDNPKIEDLVDRVRTRFGKIIRFGRMRHWISRTWVEECGKGCGGPRPMKMSTTPTLWRYDCPGSSKEWGVVQIGGRGGVIRCSALPTMFEEPN